MKEPKLKGERVYHGIPNCEPLMTAFMDTTGLTTCAEKLSHLERVAAELVRSAKDLRRRAGRGKK